MWKWSSLHRAVQGHATNKEFCKVYAQVCEAISMINMVSCYENVISLANQLCLTRLHSRFSIMSDAKWRIAFILAMKSLLLEARV